MSSSGNNNKRILIVGGYGTTGRILARLLLQYTQTTSLILAGRTPARANELIREIEQEFPDLKQNHRLTTCHVDVSDPSSLRSAFAANNNVDMVVVASSTSDYVDNVAEAALEAGIDYFDIQYSSSKIQALRRKEEDIKKAGLCFITDGGFHPGLPAVLIRQVASSFSRLETAHVGSVIKLDWAKHTVGVETKQELAKEFMDYKILTYRNGQWEKGRFMDMFDLFEMDFGEPFGTQKTFPMFLEEMRDVTDLYPTLTETGFYVGGLNWVVDWFICPIMLLTLKVWRSEAAQRAMGKFLYWGLSNFSRPPYETRLKVKACGVDRDSKPLEKTLTVAHEDGYALTAIPVAATLLQYLAEEDSSVSGFKSIRKPGLWCQATIAEPNQLLLDMKRMGVDVQPSQNGEI